MDRREDVATDGIGRRGLLKGAGGAVMLGGAASFIGAPFLSGPAEAATTTYQAESARIYRGVVEAVHPGFSGTAYVDTFEEVGSYVEWLVTVPRAVTATLIIRYSNGSTVNRSMAVGVNGTAVNPALSFLPTGAWSSWATRSLTTALRAGTNTIRVTATTTGGGPHIDLLDVNDGTDWGSAMVNSTLTRNPDATVFGSWTYYRAFYLLGQYRVYQRTRDSRYLQYIRDWIDRHVDANGNIDKAITVLDDILPGDLLLILHRETGQNKYRLAADRVRQVFNTFPRTSDGGFWHTTTQEGQLWLDSTYVALPFLARYGRAYEGSTAAYNEVANQLLIYASHLRHASNGLLYHAYDEQGDPTWANPVTHRSPEFWGRAIGWYGMTLVDVLDILPANHPQRPQLITLVQGLVAAFASFQDSTSGRWYQVVDKGSLTGNWLETSCSCMYVYIISKSIDRGYVPAATYAATYAATGRKGFQGVLTQISLGTDGRTNLLNTSEGTNVGDLAYYLARRRVTNEIHGLGAFLTMYEQVLVQSWR